MSLPYTKEKLRSLFASLPQDLKDALGSLEMTDEVYAASARKGLADEQGRKVMDLVSQVLLGLLPPDRFETALQKELTIKKGEVSELAQEINRLVFYPVRPALEHLYSAPKTGREQKEAPGENASEQPQPSRPVGADPYRESVDDTEE